MLSEFLGYLPYFRYMGYFFKIIKGIWDTGTLPPFQGLTFRSDIP